MIYFTSDLHFGHQKEFLYEPRGFNNVQTHNETIISNWNTLIKPTDTVYILGDLMLGNTEKGLENVRQLQGEIFIILGNHDTSNRIEEYNKLPNVKDICYATAIKYNNYHFYLSHYPTLTGNREEWRKVANLCGHSHTQDKWADWDKMCYHVEMDAHNCMPVNIDEVITDIRQHKEEIVSQDNGGLVNEN